VLRAARSSFATPVNYGAATCVAADQFPSTKSDATTPAVGEAFYYQVRSQNACGSGTLGFNTSTGVELTGVACN